MSAPEFEALLREPLLTRIPTGLLNYLGTNNSGHYPQRFNNQMLQPVLDLWNWYAEEQATFEVGTFSVGAAGTGYFDAATVLQVPAGQHWWLLQATAVTQAAVGAAMCFSLVRTNSANASVLQLTAPNDVPSTASAGFACSSSRDMARPILLRPSVKIRLLVTQNATAGATSVDCTLRIVRMST